MEPLITVFWPQCSSRPRFYSLQHHPPGKYCLAQLFNSCVNGHRSALNVDEIDRSIAELGDALDPSSDIDVAKALLCLAAAYAEKRRRLGMMVD